MASVKKRLAFAAASVTAVGAVTTLVAGFTFGLFSASEQSGTNSFTAGTVSVGLGTPASVTCTITNMVPGDSSAGAPIGSSADTTCTYNVKYTGSASAWLGVDVAVTNGTNPLFTSASATGLQFYLTDGTPTTYVTSSATNTTNTGDTTYKQEGGTSAALPATGVSDLLVSTTAATTGTTVSLSLDYALPLDSGDTYNTSPAASVTVVLTFHAVQSGNNALPADCAAGDQCNAGGDGSSFAWS
jgi:Camelysin metallo-endopeptidase